MNTTDAELANTLAILWTRRAIFWLKPVAWIPKYHTLLSVHRGNLESLEKRKPFLGEGSRARRKHEKL
jgi:hypothetical protein